jgi:hypothetical protein
MSNENQAQPRNMFLFLIAGYFVLQTISFVLRESIARFENPSLITALTLFFLSLWSAAGAMLSFRANDHDKENKSFILTGALIFLSPAALISALSAMFFPMPAIGIMNGLPALVACAAFSTLWIGLFSGLIMAMLFSMKNKERLSGELFYCAGLLISGTTFPLLSDHFNSAQTITALAGILVIAMAILAGIEHFKRRGFKALLWAMALCALLLDACGIYASQKLFQMYWRQAQPGWSYVKSINTPTGRMTVLNKKDEELLVLNNGAPRWQIPQDSRKHIAGMLPVTLQPNSSNLQILVIASPFSQIPHFLLELPHVGEVNLLCPYKDLIMLALSKEMLPLAPGRFFISSIPPEEYLQNTDSKFDIIMILEPGFIRNPGNSQIYRLASDKITANGVVVTVNASKQLEDPVPEDNLPPPENYFKQIMPVPGCATLIMAANSKLTSNLNELEDRLSKVSAFRGAMMPRGVLTTLYSLPENESPQPSPGLLSAIFNGKLQKSIMLPAAAAVILLLVVCIAVYVTMRFFLSRTGNYALGFGAFENGFFTMGLFVLLLIAYQQDKGDLYEKTPVFLGMLGGVAFGRILLRVPSLKTFMATISCLCPLLLYFNEIDFFYPVLLGSIFCLAVSAGMAEEILSRRVTLMKNESLPALRYFGHACGIAIFPLILFQGNGVFISVTLLLLLRLPLLFSAMPYQNKS